MKIAVVFWGLLVGTSETDGIPVIRGQFIENKIYMFS